MTKRECAIVMAYTGCAMLVGDDFDVYLKYLSEIMKRPVYTHELGSVVTENAIKVKAYPDFYRLCLTAMD